MLPTKDEVFKKALEALANVHAGFNPVSSIEKRAYDSVEAALELHAKWLKSITMSQNDIDFLDVYFDEVSFIWWEFENKHIGMSEREKLLAPYRSRLHQLRTDYPEHILMRKNYEPNVEKQHVK